MQDVTPPDLSPLRCPTCLATHVVRNGTNGSGTQTFLCRRCGGRFVENPAVAPISDATRQLIRRLLGERMSHRAIARVTGVSRTWLQAFVNELYRDESTWAIPPAPEPPAKKNAAS